MDHERETDRVAAPQHTYEPCPGTEPTGHCGIAEVCHFRTGPAMLCGLPERQHPMPERPAPDHPFEPCSGDPLDCQDRGVCHSMVNPVSGETVAMCAQPPDTHRCANCGMIGGGPYSEEHPTYHEICARIDRERQHPPQCQESALMGCAYPYGHETTAHQYTRELVLTPTGEETHRLLANSSRLLEHVRAQCSKYERELSRAEGSLREKDGAYRVLSERLDGVMQELREERARHTGCDAAMKEALRQVEALRTERDGARADAVDAYERAEDEIKQARAHLVSDSERVDAYGEQVAIHRQEIDTTVKGLQAALEQAHDENRRLSAYAEQLQGALLRRDAPDHSMCMRNEGVALAENEAKLKMAGIVDDAIQSLENMAEDLRQRYEKVGTDLTEVMQVIQPLPDDGWKTPLRHLHERWRNEEDPASPAYSHADFERLLLQATHACGNLWSQSVSGGQTALGYNLAQLRGAAYLLSVCLGKDEDQEMARWLAEQDEPTGDAAVGG